MEFPKKTAEYEELKELKESWTIAYGPIMSRRLGASLGINLLGEGEKVCSFDCPYCELGRTKLTMSQQKKQAVFPTMEQVEMALQTKLTEVAAQKIELDAITLVGNGEPTLYPEFEEIIPRIKAVRDAMAPKAKVTILSNGTTLDNSKVLRGMNLLDERMIKLDAGNDEMLKKIDGPLVRFNIQKLIGGCHKLKDVILQSFFVQGAIDNTTPSEIEDWIEVVGMIKPKMVHLYSLDRVPPTSGLHPVASQRLKEISQKLKKRTLIESQVFV